MEYYSTMRIKEILPFETTWIDLEDIMLGETSQRKTKAVGYHLFTEPKKNKVRKTKSRVVLIRGRRVG